MIKGGENMKNTLKLASLLLFAFAIFSFASKTNAQVINDSDLLDVASGVNVDIQQTDINMSDVEISAAIKEVKEANEKVILGKLNAAGSAALSSGLKTEGLEDVGEPKVEGPDLDGPGGSTYQFNGEETGNH